MKPNISKVCIDLKTFHNLPSSQFLLIRIMLAMSSSNNLQLIIFSQHGMMDGNKDMKALACKVTPPQSLVIAPELGYLATFFDIHPLINQVERNAKQTLQQYPDLPARIIATSLGGVIWVEVLSRYPEWWSRFESLVLLGSPIGGADRARIVDPFGWGIGIAKDLGKNRRELAEQIAARIPTLVIAGSTDGGGDGTVTLESTKLKHAYFVCLQNVSHVALKTDRAVIRAIREFWSQPRQPLPEPEHNLMSKLIDHFRAVPGITDANANDFVHAKTVFSFSGGVSLRTWKNPVGVKHIFIANQQGTCDYAGFVGWVHTDGLNRAIKQAIQKFGS